MIHLIERVITHWKNGWGGEILFVALMVYVLGSAIVQSIINGSFF